MKRTGSLRVVVWSLIAVVAIAGIVVWTSLGSSNRTVDVALITADSDPYWDLLIDGAESAAQASNVKITVMKGDGTVDRQNELIAAATEGDFDGLAVSPTDSNRQSTILHAAGVDHHLVTVDSDCELSGRICFVGAENYSAGRLCGEMVKEGVVVIDVGINRVTDASRKKGYRLVGDCDYGSVAAKAGWMTPVPGGVGPMTVAMLMKNTLLAARRSIYPDSCAQARHGML